MWFHRTISGSRNAVTPRHVLTLVPATSFHLTGTSIVPVAQAPRDEQHLHVEAEALQPLPPEDLARRARVSNSLNPHWVSWKGSPVTSAHHQVEHPAHDSRGTSD